MTDRSRLVLSTVGHRRHRPRPNAFRHRVWHLLLDVDHLDRATRDVWGLRLGRRVPVGFRRQDHFGDADRPLRDKVGAWVAGQGGRLPDGPLYVWAYPRVAGHVFNPVAWWFAYDRGGCLQLVVAEVRNTFGDWHAYLLDDLTHDGALVRARADKAFHVSPFLPVEGLAYDFTFRPPDPVTGTGTVSAHMQVLDGDGVVLDASQVGRLRPLTTGSLWRAVLTRPLVTLWTVGLIHGHALRLWWRRTPVHRRPPPPPTGLPAGGAPDRSGVGSEPESPDRSEEVPV